MFKSMRMWMLVLIPILVITLYALTDPNGGRETLMRLAWLSWVLIALPLAYVARRGLLEGRMKDSLKGAEDGNVAAALAFLGQCIVFAALILAMVGAVRAQDIPPNARYYLPMLNETIEQHWPDLKMRSVLAAQIEQETCITLTHPRCWSRLAELKTARENGIGLFQLTVAYRADGSELFNVFKDVRRLDPGLADWEWGDRYDARRQMIAGVLLNRQCYRSMIRLVPDEYNTLAFCDAAHNGGHGGMLNERRLCAQVQGCNPNIWFGHVEHHSLKNRQKWQGYGQSAFDINRGHVRNVMIVRRPKYAQWFGEA